MLCCPVGSGLCDGLITRPEESYRVSVCVWSRNPERGPMFELGTTGKWMNEWRVFTVHGFSEANSRPRSSSFPNPKVCFRVCNKPSLKHVLIPAHPITLDFFKMYIMLISHLCLYLPSGPSVLLTKMLLSIVIFVHAIFHDHPIKTFKKPGESNRKWFLLNLNPYPPCFPYLFL
jgi:hypothetical protein